MHERFRALLEIAGDPPQVLSIDERGGTSQLGLVLAPGCTDAELAATERALEHELPHSYKEFLRICDGAVLFLDQEYGQWGAQVHGTRQSAMVGSLQALCDRDCDLRSGHYMPFCAWAGDGDILAFAWGETSAIGGGHEPPVALIPADCPVSDAVLIAPSFAAWLDRLVCCRGEKWWEWGATR